MFIHPHIRRRLRLALLPMGVLLAWVFLPSTLLAQQNRLVPAEDPLYGYIQRLQHRGRLLELNPTALPYTQSEILAAAARVDTTALSRVERAWLAHLVRTLRPAPNAPGEMTAGGRIDGKLISANTDRHDLLRPFGEGDAVLTDGQGTLYMEYDRWIVHAGVRHSLYYDRDPDGIDSVRRLYIRNEDSYAGYSSPLFGLYAGRFSNQWGSVGSPALTLSNNPRSYDQLHLRLGGGRLALRGIFGELDAVRPDGVFTGDAFEDGSRRRFISAHRLDWRPHSRLTVTLLESLLISGVNAQPSVRYIMPATLFYITTANRPRNDENNGAMAAMVWWQTGRLTFETEFLVDDFDFLRRDASSEPAAIAFRQSLHAASLTPTLDAGASFTAVGALTYAAQQREGKYLYLLRGLGTQFNDYVHARLYADVFLDVLIPGLRLTPQLHLLAQGERTILDDWSTTMPDGSPLKVFLNGTVTSTVRPALGLFYQPSPWFWLRADLGVNAIRNAGHVEGVSETRFVGMLEVGGRVTLDRRFSLFW